MKLKFNNDAWYNGQLIAKKGEIKEVDESNGFAQRWINRGAEVVKETAPVVVEAAQAVEAPIEEVKEVVKELPKVENKKGKKIKSKE